MNGFPQPGELPVVVNGCAEGEGGRDRINGSSENHRNRSYRLAIHNVAAVEALVLGMKAGLDGAQGLRLVGEGAGSSRMLQLRGPMMVKGRYRPATMTLANFEKDPAIIAAFARKVGVRTPLFSAAEPIYAAATRKNRSLDTAAVFAVMERMARDRV
jgi:L-threonate 2-dehydrogenase